MRRLALIAAGLVPAMLFMVAAAVPARAPLSTLRLSASLGSAILLLASQKCGAHGWRWPLIAILVLFNPFVPVPLPWTAARTIGFLAAVLLVVMPLTLDTRPRRN